MFFSNKISIVRMDGIKVPISITANPIMLKGDVIGVVIIFRDITEEKEMPFYGDGTTQRDYTYIDDIIDGILKSIVYLEENENIYEIINLGESETVSLRKMVETLEKEIGKKAVLKQLSMQPGDRRGVNAVDHLEGSSDLSPSQSVPM